MKEYRNSEQIVDALQRIIGRLDTLNARTTQIEERGRAIIRADIDRLCATSFPAPAEILSALRLPFNTTEGGCREAIRQQVAAMRKGLDAIARTCSERRKEVRVLRRKCAGIIDVVKSAPENAIAAVLEDANRIVDDVEPYMASAEAEQASFEHTLTELRLIRKIPSIAKPGSGMPNHDAGSPPRAD